MKIGLISDTHKKVKKAQNAVALLLDHGAEFIIHAGDIVKIETLDLLKNCGKPYVAVYGNNDAHLLEEQNNYNLVQEPHYFKLADTKFKLMHLPFFMAPDTEIVLYGHTHKFECRFKDGTLFLNPGEVCARNKPMTECAMLEVTDTTFLVTRFAKELEEENFEKREFSYTRIKND